MNLKNNMTSKIIPLFGNGSCYENLKKLFCGWNCDPNMNSYTSLAVGATQNNLTVYIDPFFYNGLFESCLKVCVNFGGGIEVQKFWSSAERKHFTLQIFNH